MRALTVAIAFFLFGGMASANDDRLKGLNEVSGGICGATQIGIFGDTTTVLANATIYYKVANGPWMKSPVPLPGHSLARMPNGHWVMNYSDEKGKVVEVDDLSGKGRKIVRSKLAGFKLFRPHDQIVDPDTGDIYLIDGNRRLFRFKNLKTPSEAWTFTADQLGYDRAVSWFDGHLHIIDSSRGEVIRVDSYERHEFTIFRSPRPARNPQQVFYRHPFLHYDDRDFIGGTLSSTGLLLDDVDKEGDWYYGSNEFSAVWSPGTDARPARLIRWRTWEDFEKGKWEDLSSYIPGNDVPYFPYFLTIHDGTLYSGLTAREPDKCPGILQLDLRSLGE